jgi:Methyltransferase domain
MSNHSLEQTRSLRDLPAFSSQPWQMSYGERSTIEGVLAMVKPALAIEIGRAEGGSLRRIAEHSEEVVSFDIVESSSEVARLANVHAMAGDSHAMLPVELRRLSEARRNVDFVLVDGDHTTAGVRQDMLDLLDSPAIGSTVILAHDTLNEEVRRGLEDVDYESYGKVAWVDLDFVPGYVAQLPARLGECWGGLGLVVVDSSGTFQANGPIRSNDLFEQHKLVWPSAQAVRRDGSSALERLGDLTFADAAVGAPADVQRIDLLIAEVARRDEWLRGIEGSASWRLTAPLRTLKRRLLKRLS